MKYLDSHSTFVRIRFGLVWTDAIIASKDKALNTIRLNIINHHQNRQNVENIGDRPNIYLAKVRMIPRSMNRSHLFTPNIFCIVRTSSSLYEILMIESQNVSHSWFLLIFVYVKSTIQIRYSVPFWWRYFAIHTYYIYSLLFYKMVELNNTIRVDWATKWLLMIHLDFPLIAKMANDEETAGRVKCTHEINLDPYMQ